MDTSSFSAVYFGRIETSGSENPLYGVGKPVQSLPTPTVSRTKVCSIAGSSYKSSKYLFHLVGSSDARARSTEMRGVTPRTNGSIDSYSSARIVIIVVILPNRQNGGRIPISVACQPRERAISGQ